MSRRMCGVAGLEEGPVGRQAESAALVAGFDAAARGEAGVMLLQGPPGSGKTMLLDSFEEHARRAGATVLRSSCTRDRVDADWHALTTLSSQTPCHPGYARLPVPHRFFRQVTALAASGPLAVVIDDALWCDERSIVWLDLMVGRAQHMPLFLLFAQRTTGPPGSRRAITWGGPYRSRVIDLAPLPDDAASELAARTWRREPEPVFVRACNDVCRGIPSLLRRLFTHLRAERVSPDLHGVSRAKVTGAELYAGHLLAKLETYPEYVHRALEAVAVLGRTDPVLVGMLSGLPEPLAAAAVEALRSEGIIGGAAVWPDDAPVRSRTLRAIPTSELNQRRELAARLLNDSGQPAEEISAQLEMLTELSAPWMAGVLSEAARNAARNGALETAARYLARVIAAYPADLDARLSFAEVSGRDNPRAAYAALEQSFDMAPDVPTQARIAIHMGTVALRLRRGPDALGSLSAVLDRLRAIDVTDPDLRASVESMLLMVGLSRCSTAAVARERVKELRPSGGHTPADCELLAASSLASMLFGASAEVSAAQAFRALAPQHALRSPVLGAAAHVLWLADEVDAAVSAIDNAVAHSVDRGAFGADVDLLSTRSRMRSWVGDLAGAMSDATVAVELAGDRPGAEGTASPHVALAEVLSRRGDVDLAAHALERADGIDEDSLFVYPQVLMIRSYLADCRGDHERALEHLTECGVLVTKAGLRSPTFAPWWLEAARLLSRMERLSEAHELVEQGEELAASWGSASARGIALLARGSVTRAEEGVELLLEAVRTLSTSPARWYLARAESMLGKALLRLGDRSGSRLHFRRAVDTSVRCGFRVLMEAARAGLVAAGGRMYHVTGSTTDVLTNGERRVAGFAATGATNREIADALHIAVRTVEIHLTSVYRKLHLAGRQELLRVSGRPARVVPCERRELPSLSA